MASKRSNSDSPSWHHRITGAATGLWHASGTKGGRVAWTCGGIAAGVLALALFVPVLSRQVDKPVDEVQISFDRVPQWAGPSIVDHLGNLALAHLEGTTLSRPALASAHHALLNSGFFESVQQVRRTGMDQVTIEAVLVAPLAQIQDRHGTAMIDANGHLMPRGCGVSGDIHMVTIVNPRYSRPARPREVWSGGDLAAAIGVLGQIADAPWIDQVKDIDLSRYAASGNLVLITDNGSRIVWGSAPGNEKAMESLLDRKIKRLDHLHRTSGRIDQYHSGEIDITDASVVVKR
jgi:hypothetical protein